MNSWNFTNSVFKVASRINYRFCRAFNIQVTKTSNLFVEFFEDNDSMPKITMIDKSRLNGVEIYFHRDFINLDHADKKSIEKLVYDLGHDIIDCFNYFDNVLFLMFKEGLEYPSYKDKYEFLVNGEKQEIETDFPLLHYLQTEFEVHHFLSYDFYEFDERRDIQRNGKPLFNILEVLEKDNICRLNIEIVNGKIEVNSSMRDFKLYTHQIMKLLTSYIKATRNNSPQNNGAKTAEIFFTKEKSDLKIKIERIKTNNFTKSDWKAALPVINEHLGFPNNEATLKHWEETF